METCYGDVPLDDGIRSRRVDGVNGLSMHILEAGFRHPGRPVVLLLHGFPELAFSWRKLMPLIAARAASSATLNSRTRHAVASVRG